MSTVVDTSVLIDLLRGHGAARDVLATRLQSGVLLASEVTRLEILAGMRPGEEPATRSLFGALLWQPLDEQVAERAGDLGRTWLPGHRKIDAADLAIAATALLHDAELVTLNVRHFPMFPGLRRPY